MTKTGKIIFVIFIFLLLFTLFALLIRNGNMQLLNPQGYIADMQSKILLGALLLALCLGTGVISATFFIAFRYREKNAKAQYAPSWTSGKLLTAFWWIFPASLVVVISFIIWQTAHMVDPYKEIASKTQPVTIQVVALRWKWLFLYPKEHIATVNFIEFPENTPVNFQLTADAPMNSFWIPSLGVQIYAMAGMSTSLHLLADKTGVFAGGGAEISGNGFAGMQFKVHSVTKQQYSAWVSTVQKTGKRLDFTSYARLARPGSYVPPTFYKVEDNDLYNKIIGQFMPSGKENDMSKMKGM